MQLQSRLSRNNLRGATRTWLVVVLVVAAGAGLAWWKWHAAQTGNAGAPGAAAGPGAWGGRRFAGGGGAQPVSVAPVGQQDIRVSVDAIGTLAALNTAVVRAQVSGVLTDLKFKEGQEVQAGQWLAQIDPRPFQASLAQAEGALARDSAQLEAARVDLARYRDLLAKDAVARQQLDTQQALVHQLEGTVRVDQGAVDNARLQLAYTRISAPIAGRVGLKQVDLGNVVQPGDAAGVVSITQTRPMTLVFAVPSANLLALQMALHSHQRLPVQAFDASGRTPLAQGEVTAIDNAIDPSTDTIKVKSVFPNKDDRLFPNQTVSARLQLSTLSGVLAVPQAAVLRGAKGFYVYVVNADHTVATRVVQPGAVDEGQMAVQGELQAGEQVVIDGSDRLREGAKVEVIAADPAQRSVPGARAVGVGRSKKPDGPGTFEQNSHVAPVNAASEAIKNISNPGAIAAQPAVEPASPTSPAPASGDAATTERPRWLDRLPPEVAEKVMKMSPDERREWIRKRREERANSSGSGG